MRIQKSILQNVDWTLIILYLTLCFIGFFTIYAAIYSPKTSTLLDFSARHGKQLIWIAAAIVIALAILQVDASFYELFGYIIYAGTILLLIGVLLFGREVAGSKSWFELGSIRLQPAEFAKFATVLCLAKYLSSFSNNFKELKTKLIAIGIMLLPAFMVILQNDTGSALVYSILVLVLYREGLSGNFLLIGIGIAVIFVLTLVIDKLILISCLAGIASIIIYFVRKNTTEIAVVITALLLSSGLIFSVDYVFENVLREHQKTRITVLLGEEDKLQEQLDNLRLELKTIDKKTPAYQKKRDQIRSKRQSLRDLKAGAGWNIRQSKIAIGSGSFSGKGYLQGTQTKFNFVPEQSTDFIFCTIGEEWGFLGSFLLVCLYMGLFARIIFVAERQKSQFARIYGYGVASILFFHFTINIAMTIGLAPTIGIPLPFLSYGGSSLWAFTILLFIFIKLDSNRAMIL